jgi:hypothetical protein
MRSLAMIAALMVGMASVCVAKNESEATEFVNQHLNSIGTEQARAAVKNRLAQGTVTFQILNRGPQTWEGPATVVSEGEKMASSMKFPPTVYRTEWFTRDGNRTSIAPVIPGRWTEFGDFIKAHDEILTEGLWGGTLSTGWALSHLDARRAKLQDRGVKKVDGVELHRIDYSPKKGSDLEIQLYFEPSTFRHVMTVYLMTITAHSGRTVNEARNEQELHYRLEERFGDFTTVDNINLPTRWIVRFTYGTVSNGVINQYDVTAKKLSHNISLDPRNFEIK